MQTPAQKSQIGYSLIRSHTAQITLFISLVIFILIIAVISTYLIQSNGSNQVVPTLTSNSQLSEQSITESVNYCLRETGDLATRIVLLQGGYWKLPIGSADAIYFGTPYLFENNKSLPVPIETVEKSISRGVDTILIDCLSNQGVDITSIHGKPNTRTILTEKDTIISTEIPIAMSQKDSVTITRSFNQKIGLPILNILNLTNEMLALQESNPYSIPASDLIRMMDRENGLFNLMQAGPQEYIYFFSLDHKPESIQFAFAVKLEKAVETK